MISEANMMHGRDYKGDNLSGWLLSEKFDGCRAWWDGARMWSRSGNEIEIPDHWRASLPSTALEGEIWAGYHGFLAARAAVNEGKWNEKIMFIIFDAPSSPGTWLQRLDAACDALGECEFASVVEPVVATGCFQMRRLLVEIKARGGEGLMARHPANLYAAGRTGEIRKIKRNLPFSWQWYHDEMEKAPDLSD